MPSSTRLFVVGDSHTACLKQAWDSVKDEYPHLDLVFFAAPGAGLDDLTLEEGKLVPETAELKNYIESSSGGLTSLNPNEFHAGLLVGMGLKKPVFDDGVFYSKAVVFETINDNIEESLSLKLFKLIRQISTLDLYVAHGPLVADEEDAKESSDFDDYRNWIKTVDDSYLKDGSRVLVSQPEETLSSSHNTKFCYSIDSQKNNRRGADASKPVKYGLRGIKHMNTQFGELFLKKFFADDFKLSQ